MALLLCTPLRIAFGVCICLNYSNLHFRGKFALIFLSLLAKRQKRKFLLFQAIVSCVADFRGLVLSAGLRTNLVRSNLVNGFSIRADIDN